MTEPSWLLIARQLLGVRELPGAPTAPVIAGWLLALKAWWSDDATPWCGTYCATVMKEAGLPYPAAWYRAKAWLDWGVPLSSPWLGCVAVFDRAGGGHVGFVVGQDRVGRLMVLGGNQGDAVSIAPFEPSRAVGYRWPPAALRSTDGARILPVLTSAGLQLSTNEA